MKRILCRRKSLVIIAIFALTLGALWVVLDLDIVKLVPLQKEDCFLTDQQQKDLRYILRNLIVTLDEMNVTYWLDFGTLLGALRNGDILSHDTDGDVALLANDEYRPQEVKEKLQKRGIKFNYKTTYFCRAKYNGMWVDVTRWTVYGGVFNGRKTQMLRKDLTPEEEKKRRFVNRYTDTEDEFPLAWLNPRISVKFMDINAKIPNESGKLLRKRYPYSYWFSMPYKVKCWF